MLKKDKISVVGLGKLGLCFAVSLAEKGFNVVGVDIEEKVVDFVNKGVAPWYEPRLDELLKKHGGKRLIATTNHSEAIEKTDITFILVATPSLPDGSFSNRFIEASLTSLAKSLSKSKKEEHLFVISSTVMPESTERFFIPLLEKYSGRKINQGFSVCYDPDFVALGNVIKGFLSPDFVVIGQSSDEAGKIVESIHKRMCDNDPPIFRMSIINAELAKVCLNAYITVKISFANSIANLCEKVPGANVDVITKAIGVDKRISPYYFQGGLSFGGTCFPRDVRAYRTVAQKYNVQAEIIHAVDKVNKLQDEILFNKVYSEIEKNKYRTVGILGLAFTTNTPVVTESPAIKLIQKLLKKDIVVLAYDSLAIDNARNIFGSGVEYVESPEVCLSNSELCVLTLRDKHLKEAVESFQPESNLTIIDCWRILESEKLDKRIKLISFGSYNFQCL